METCPQICETPGLVMWWAGSPLASGTTGIQWPDLQNILRQSYDYLTIMPKLPSTYDRRL